MLRYRLLPLLLLCVLAPATLAQFASGQIGNLNPPVPPSVENIVVGNQAFAYLVDPAASGLQGPGFQLEAVHMLLDFTPSQVPVNIVVSAGLMHAVWDQIIDQWVPGDQMCATPPITYTIANPGLFDVMVPVTGGCGCRPMDDMYFLIIRFHEAFQADLPTDGQPQPGIVYMDDAGFWVDMFGFKRTATGKGIIWGDIITCSAPVGAEPTTWGGVKALYR